MLFKNRELRITTVKTPKNTEDTTPTPEEVLNPDSINLFEKVGKEMVKHLALTVIAVVVAIKVTDALCEIAVKKTTRPDNE